MRSFIVHLFLTAALLSLLPGCSVLPAGDAAAAAGVDQLPTGLHGVQLDAEQVPRYEDVESQLAQFNLAAATRSLTDAECACLAASRCGIAKVLDKEAASLQRELHRHRRRTPSNLLPPILQDRAAQERNDAAEQALLAYYQLAEIHLQNSVLSESYSELDRVRRTVDGLLGAGVPMETDRTQLDRNLLQLNLQQAQLRVNETRLTAQVKTLIGEDPFSPEAIETACRIEPRPVGYSLIEAMEIAREHDFELKAIRRMLHSGDVEDLDVARGLLRVASPMLGQEPVKLGFLAKVVAVVGHDDSGDRELSLRKQQLRELYQVRQQQLDLEVANEVVSVQERYLDVGIARDVLESWRGRVTSLQSRRELQKSDYQDIVNARVELLKAKADLVHKLILLEMAHARLRGVMGLLGQECAAHGSQPDEPGRSPHEPCRPSDILRDLHCQ